MPLAKHGRPAKGEEGKGDDVTFTRGTNGSEYLKRRLARDNPKVLERWERGEGRYGNSHVGK